jgi:hypothetical protein
MKNLFQISHLLFKFLGATQYNFLRLLLDFLDQYTLSRSGNCYLINGMLIRKFPGPDNFDCNCLLNISALAGFRVSDCCRQDWTQNSVAFKSIYDQFDMLNLPTGRQNSFHFNIRTFLQLLLHKFELNNSP